MAIYVWPYLMIFMIISSSLNFSYALYEDEDKYMEQGLLSKCPKCKEGFHCVRCLLNLKGPKCVRSATIPPYKFNDSLPFNKYAFLATHNSFAIKSKSIFAISCQEDSVTEQLRNGVRALMLDMYEFKGDIWLCHSSRGKCHDNTKFGLAIDTLKEVEAFLTSNPTDIVTLILEDYVQTQFALNKLFEKSGLLKYWFPYSRMPMSAGDDWPSVNDMVYLNHRLVVFTSDSNKLMSEGIPRQWDFMVENRYGDKGMKRGECTNREESTTLNDKTKALVLVNYIRSLPLKMLSCIDNDKNLKDMLCTCHDAAANRWPNFIAVDFYKRSQGGGVFEALDMINGIQLCGRDNVNACVKH